MNEFEGKIGRTREQSTPHWQERATANADSPNVVIIYMDDMGWSDPGCYGSEIQTPHIDALAARGLQFTDYTTHPICSPARAALLTGRNAHAAGTGWLANNNPGYPGYSGEIPLDQPTIAETLRAAGYETIMTGKWHNTPTPDTVAGGSKHNWPSQRGFDNFYGFLDGETHFFFPSRLQIDNTLMDIDLYAPDYYATDDWTDQAIKRIKALRASAPQKPFFLYLAHNAVHAPLQSKPEDREKYRGVYDAGWNELRRQRFQRQLDSGLVPPQTRLPESDSRVTPWQRTDPRDRMLFARHMETYAAMLDCVDQNVGKLVDCLNDIGELDNTIMLFSSDNGGTDGGGALGMLNNNRRYMGLGIASIEDERANAGILGDPQTISLYPTGWGEVCNTPFPSFKTYTGAGGRRVSFLVSWPRAIADRGAIRRQFVHVTDVMPTLLDLLEVPALERVNDKQAKPMDGMSFANVLSDGEAESPRREQYYECWSNRAYQRDGWLARSIQKRGEPIDMDNWTLHDLNQDFSESTDIAGQHPARLQALVEAFDKAAWENMVYPLDNRDRFQKFADSSPAARAAADRPRRFLPGMQTTHREDIVPLIDDRSFTIDVAFDHTAADEGVLWAIGDPIAGMLLYVEGGKLRFHFNGFGETTDLPAVELPAGPCKVRLDYEALGERKGRGRLLQNDEECVSWHDLSPTLTFGLFEGLDVGIVRRGPVLWDLYDRHGAFAYSGRLHEVRVAPALNDRQSAGL